MKKKIIIESSNGIVFKGKMMNMPIKKSSIIEKSIDLFDDDDPCIIHTSFVIKHYAEFLLDIFKNQNTDTLIVKDHLNDVDFLDFEDLESLKITLK